MAEVLVVVYDGVQLLDVAGPLEAFDGASRAVPDLYRVRLASLGGRDVVTSSGVRLGVEADLARVEGGLDTLLVAGGWGYADAAGDRELVGQVRRLSAGARRTVSVGPGAFVLAAAGLLDGRRATTHWAYCAELAATYPAVTVEPDAIFVRDAGVATSAGVTAGLDLALALIEEDHGAEPARRVARWLVVFLQRPGGQSQFSMWSRARPPGDDALRRLLGEIAADPGADHSVVALAGRLSVSERHVSRLFAREVGMTPGRYVERTRVEAAQSLLETGREGVDRIARRCGFGTAESMRRAFVREIGVPPSTYRDRFTGTAAMTGR
jgi:transcriptional regulator GlxA family with amidase domain